MYDADVPVTVLVCVAEGVLGLQRVVEDRRAVRGRGTPARRRWSRRWWSRCRSPCRSTLGGASGRLAVVIPAVAIEVAGAEPLRNAVTVNRWKPGGTVTDACRTPGLTVASDCPAPDSCTVNPSTGVSRSKSQVTCTSPDCSCVAVTPVGADSDPPVGVEVGVGRASATHRNRRWGRRTGRGRSGTRSGCWTTTGRPARRSGRRRGRVVENVGSSTARRGCTESACPRRRAAGAAGRRGGVVVRDVVDGPGRDARCGCGVARDRRQVVVEPDDRRHRAVLGDRDAVLGAGDVDEEHAVVEHQRGLAPVRQLDVLAGARALGVQPDDLRVAGTGHVDRPLEGLRPVGSLAADRAHVDLVHGAAGDDRDRPGLRVRRRAPATPVRSRVRRARRTAAARPRRPRRPGRCRPGRRCPGRGRTG